jgi:hypothetical protein
MAKNISVMGIYPDRTAVSDAISVLQGSGYRAADISVLSSDNQGTKDFAVDTRSKWLEGAALGSLAGAAAGAALAWFASTQPVAIPLTATLAAAGAIVAAAAGAGAGGALGWIAGLLAGLRSTEYIARRYAGRIRRGGILLSVHCDSSEWCGRAQKTLRDTGARNISIAPEASADFGTSDRPTDRAPIAIVARTEVPVEGQPVAVLVEPAVRDSIK